MKKIIVLFSIIVLVGLASCENPKLTKLKKTIKEANEACPVNMGMVGTLLSIKFDENENEVKVYFSIDDDITSIDVIRENEQMFMKTLKLSFSDADQKVFLKELIEAGVGMSVIYEGASSGKSHKFTFTLDDLKEIYNNPLSEKEINQLYLENEITTTNASLPSVLDEGMELVRMFDDGKNVVYLTLLDEEIYDIDDFKYSWYEAKQSIRESFGDPILKRFLEKLKSLDKGLVYRYQGKQSGKSCDITFIPEEL